MRITKIINEVKMTTIYISKKNRDAMEALRIELIIKRKSEVKRAELFSEIIRQGIKNIKEKESL